MAVTKRNIRRMITELARNKVMFGTCGYKVSNPRNDSWTLGIYVHVQVLFQTVGH